MKSLMLLSWMYSVFNQFDVFLCAFISFVCLQKWHLIISKLHLPGILKFVLLRAV